MAYEEVVTHVKVRYVDVPGVAGQVALLTMDNGFDHTKPNTWGEQGLASLQAAMDEVEAHSPAVTAIAVTGKPFIFNVGADLKGVGEISSREQIQAVGTEGHKALRRLKDAKVPTFAFVNGAVMGGGLETALHCDYRTLSSGAAAIALPECFLGLVPGWGGTQLLPQLIGPEKAIKVIVENALAQNTMLKPAVALELGVFDVMFEPADFLELSFRWLADVLSGRVTPNRAKVDLLDSVGWEAAVAAGRAVADGRVHGAAPAAYKALDLISLARTADFDAGSAAETDALADLVMGDELRAGIYAFNLVNGRAKRPAGAPDKALARPVTKVGVVGAGLMASQFALLFARRLEVPVVLTDIDQARVDKGVAYVHGEIDKLLSRKRLSPDKANGLKALVTGSLTKDVFSDADIVIEAVFEELSVKKQVFAEVEAVVSDTCLLLTNTSSLSVTEMAADLAHPERVVGFHFFNPVAVLPLLEIVKAEKTDDASLATAFATAKKLGKSAVLVKDAPAFVVNRLLTRFLGEVTKAVDAGLDPVEADSALAPLGLPMPPFVLLSLVGPAVALHVAETMHEAYPSRFGVSENLKKLVAAGKTGIYGFDGKVDPEVAALFTAVPGEIAPTVEELRERALAALAEEIRIMLDEGVVQAAEDIDLCMILGAGWPFHLGGITPYLDRTGVSEKTTGSRFLAPGVASLPA